MFNSRALASIPRGGEIRQTDLVSAGVTAADRTHACYVGLHLVSSNRTVVIPSLSESGIFSQVARTRLRNGSVGPTSNPKTSVPDLQKGMTLPAPTVTTLDVPQWGFPAEGEYNQIRQRLVRELLDDPARDYCYEQIPFVGGVVIMVLIARADPNLETSDSSNTLVLPETIPGSAGGAGAAGDVGSSPGGVSPALSQRLLHNTATQTPGTPPFGSHSAVASSRTRSSSASSVATATTVPVPTPPLSPGRRLLPSSRANYYSLFVHGPKIGELMSGPVGTFARTESSSSILDLGSATLRPPSSTTLATATGDTPYSRCIQSRDNSSPDVISVSNVQGKEICGILEVVLPRQHIGLMEGVSTSGTLSGLLSPTGPESRTISGRPSFSRGLSVPLSPTSPANSTAGAATGSASDRASQMKPLSDLILRLLSSALRDLVPLVTGFLASSDYAAISAGSDMTAMSLISAYSNPTLERFDFDRITPPSLGGLARQTKRGRSSSTAAVPYSLYSLRTSQTFSPLSTTHEEPSQSPDTGADEPTLDAQSTASNAETAPEDDEFEEQIEGAARNLINPTMQFIVPGALARTSSAMRLVRDDGVLDESKSRIPAGIGARTRSAINSLRDGIAEEDSQSIRGRHPGGSKSERDADALGQSTPDDSASDSAPQLSGKSSSMTRQDSSVMSQTTVGSSSGAQVVVKGGDSAAQTRCVGAVDVSEGEDGINWRSFLPLGLVSVLDRYMGKEALNPQSTSADFVPIRAFAAKAVVINQALVLSKMRQARAASNPASLMTASDDDYAFVRFNLYHIYTSPGHKHLAPRDSLEFAAYVVALSALKQNLVGKRKGPTYLIPATGNDIFKRAGMKLNLEASADVAGGRWGDLALPETYELGGKENDNDDVSSGDELSGSPPSVNRVPSLQPPIIPNLFSTPPPAPAVTDIDLKELSGGESNGSLSDNRTAEREAMRQASRDLEARRESLRPRGSGAMTKRSATHDPIKRFHPLDTTQYIGFKFYTDLFNMASGNVGDSDDTDGDDAVEASYSSITFSTDSLTGSTPASRRNSARASHSSSSGGFRRQSIRLSFGQDGLPLSTALQRNSSCTAVELIRQASTISDNSKRGTLNLDKIRVFRAELSGYSSFGWPNVPAPELALFRTESFDILAYTEDELLVLLAQLFESMWPEVNGVRLRRFLLAVRRNYRRNPFHNLHHGIHVVHFIYMVLSRMPEFVDIVDPSATRGPGMPEPNPTFMAYRGTHLDVIALFVAGLCHDIDHPGNNNTYEINSSSPLALLHNDSAVLEHHHASITMALLRDPELNIFANAPPAQVRSIRAIIISSILGTDMALHFENCNKLASSPVYTELKLTDPERPARKFFFDTLVHTADICAQLYPFDIAQEWEARISEEFMIQAIVEGVQDLPVAPYMLDLHHPQARYKGQIAFLSAILTPWWNQLIKIFKNNKAIEYYYANLNKNLNTYNLLASRAAKFEEVMDAVVAGALDAVETLRKELNPNDL